MSRIRANLKEFEQLLLSSISTEIVIIIIFFCWLAAWEHSYEGTPWRLNHFDVITL